MVAVKAEKGESADRLIRRFIKKIKKSNMMEELRERRYYKKPSEKRKEAKRKRQATLNKLARERRLAD